jgi:hypothetical protein
MSDGERRQKSRVYVDEPEDAPDNVEVQTGMYGGTFYYPDGSPRQQTTDSEKEILASVDSNSIVSDVRATIETTSFETPGREAKQTELENAADAFENDGVDSLTHREAFVLADTLDGEQSEVVQEFAETKERRLRADLVDEVQVGEEFDGFETFIVGGAVRDHLLGEEAADIDLMAIPSDDDISDPIEVLSDRMEFIDTESAFPVFVDGQGREVALPRREESTGLGFSDFEARVVDPERPVDEALQIDLERRDMTIGAMAVNARSGEMADPYGGNQSLIDREIRPVGEAFKEDPVRLLRTARFAPRFDMDVGDEIKTYADEMGERVETLPDERTMQELTKTMTQAEEPGRFFEVLDDLGVIEESFPVVQTKLQSVSDKMNDFRSNSDSVNVGFAGLGAGLGGDADAFVEEQTLSNVQEEHLSFGADVVDTESVDVEYLIGLGERAAGGGSLTVDTIEAVFASLNDADYGSNVRNGVETAVDVIEEVGGSYVMEELGIDGSDIGDTITGEEFGELVYEQRVDRLTEQVGDMDLKQKRSLGIEPVDGVNKRNYHHKRRLIDGQAAQSEDAPTMKRQLSADLSSWLDEYDEQTEMSKDERSSTPEDVPDDADYLPPGKEPEGSQTVVEGPRGGRYAVESGGADESDTAGSEEDDGTDTVETPYGDVPDTSGPLTPSQRSNPIGSEGHPVLWDRPEPEEFDTYVDELQESEFYGRGAKKFNESFNGDKNTEAYHSRESETRTMRVSDIRDEYSSDDIQEITEVTNPVNDRAMYSPIPARAISDHSSTRNAYVDESYMVPLEVSDMDEVMFDMDPKRTMQFLYDGGGLTTMQVEDVQVEFTTEGGYTQDRLEKHDEWTDELLNDDAVAEPDEKPIGMVLLGPPGAGKGYWQEQVQANEYGETGEFVERDFTALSSDRTKEPIPEYNGTNAAEVHDEASKMAKDNLAPKAIDARHNVILDKVSATPDNTIEVVEMMEEAGYDIRATFVGVPREKAAHNAVGRFYEAGRFTPMDYLDGQVYNDEGGSKSRESFDTVVERFEIPEEKVGVFNNDVEWGEIPEPIQVGEELLKFYRQFFGWDFSEDKNKSYKFIEPLLQNGDNTNGETRPGRDERGDNDVDGSLIQRGSGGGDSQYPRRRRFRRRVTAPKSLHKHDAVGSETTVSRVTLEGLKGPKGSKKVRVKRVSQAPDDTVVSVDDDGLFYKREVGTRYKLDWWRVTGELPDRIVNSATDVLKLLSDAYEKQVWPDDLAKASRTWTGQQDVEANTRDYVDAVISQMDPLHGDYKGVPHLAAQKVEEHIRASLTQHQGWSTNSVAKRLENEFSWMDSEQAENIARMEVAAVLNTAKSVMYKAAEPTDEVWEYKWVGPSDSETTALCEEVKSEISDRGGQVPLTVMKDILREEAREYANKGGTPERVEEYIPHYQCRHTLERVEAEE